MINLNLIQQKFIEIRDICLEHPLSILSSFTASGSISLLIFENDKSTNHSLTIIVLFSILGIPTFLCTKIIADSKEFSKLKRWIFNLVSLIFLCLIAIFFSNQYTHSDSSNFIFSYLICFLITHLLISISPLFFKLNESVFHKFNEILFLRFLKTILYTGIYMLGFSMFFIIISMLLINKSPEDFYLSMLVFIGISGGTIHFFKALPTNLKSIDPNTISAGRFKKFLIYFILPFLLLYECILLIYGFKILLSWDWPQGIVAFLILSISTIGFFLFLFLYQHINQLDTVWLKKIKGFYFAALIPLAILFYLALHIRIMDYGMTISRYFSTIMAIWILGASIFCLFYKKYLIYIPISMVITLLTISIGPWSIYHVSEQSQIKRLKNILEENKILNENKIYGENIWMLDSLPQLKTQSPSYIYSKMPDSLQNEIISIFQYLEKNHDYDSLKFWFSQNLDSIQTKINGINNHGGISKTEIYARTLGLNYDNYDNSIEKNRLTIYAKNENTNLIDISGFDYVAHFDLYIPPNTDTINLVDFSLDALEGQLVFVDKEKQSFQLRYNNKVIIFDHDKFISFLVDQYRITGQDILASNMKLTAEDTKYVYTLKFDMIELDEVENDVFVFNGASLHLLIKEK